jgi:hypothetical protein
MSSTFNVRVAEAFTTYNLEVVGSGMSSQGLDHGGHWSPAGDPRARVAVGAGR